MKFQPMVYRSFQYPSLLLSFCISLALFVPGYCKADRVDSLKQIIQKMPGNQDIVSMMREARKLANSSLDGALAYMEAAKELALKDQDNKELYTIYRKIGFIYEDHELHEKALETFERALQIADEKLHDKNCQLTSYNDLALAHEKLGQYKIAKDYYHNTIKLGNEINNQEIVEYSYHGLGSLYNKIGDYDKALENYLLAEEIAVTIGSQEGMVTSLRSIALTYGRLNKQELALDMIQQAYQISSKLNDTLMMGNVLYEYGNIYAYSKDYISAFDKYERSAHLFAQKQHFPFMVRAKMEMANMSVQQNLLEKALGYYSQCTEYEPFINEKTNAELFFHIGTLYKKLGKLQDAESALLKSFANCEAHHYKELCQKNSYMLYLIYADSMQYDKAVAYLEMSENLEDEIYDEKKTQRITELQFKYDVEKSDKELHTLQLRQNKIYLVGFASFCGVVILFMFIVVGFRGHNNTVLKKKSREFKKQYTKLKESNEVLKQFAYVAAHDLKEPLRNIGSFVNLLQKRYGGQFNDEAQEYMGFVTNGARRMNNLLEDLLEYSRISAQEPTNDLIDIQEVLEEVTSNLKDKIRQSEAVIECPADIPPIPMNRLHLMQLFQNLIGNALKFVDGKPVIKINAYYEGDSVVLSIQDNGIGIDKSFGNKIFNLFHQLNKNNKYEGTGIGLTIVKNIVDKYDGKLWFESEVNQGTTFFISLFSHRPKETVAEGTIMPTHSNYAANNN